MPRPVLLAKAHSSLFTVFDSGARLPRGVLWAPLPVSLAQNSLANAGPQERACPFPCSLFTLTYLNSFEQFDSFVLMLGGFYM
jgi:hypothetical protein